MNIQGKVTFRKDLNTASDRGETGGVKKRTGGKTSAGEDGAPEGSSRMLKTEEIRDICDRHQLTRMEVYKIRSQFAGMVIMSKEAE